MSRSAPALATGLLAFLSGVPALIYQVVWTRQVALLAGGQIGAISVVLVAFFGGLALGARWLGPVADRSASPLRLYGGLEIAAGLLAGCGLWAMAALGASPELPDAALLAAGGAVLLPVTFLLGGTLPALLRATAKSPDTTAGHAGRLTGANTAGSVAGVAIAVAAIPEHGLRASLLAASAGAIAVGAVAWLLARPATRSAAASAGERRAGVPAAVLAAAFLVGGATLGYEVLATRMATLRLGSSLYAWGLVLGLFLVGLAAGNLALAQRARRTRTPALDLGWLEVAAACSVAAGLAALRPDIASPATGLSPANLLRTASAVVPASFCMGGAFPMLVRLAVRDSGIAAAFGRLSAVNTLGGIAGALLAPFALLPALGSAGACLVFAAANAFVGLAFLATAPAAAKGRRVGAALLCVAIACLPVALPVAPPNDPWVLFVAEGRQATAVVTSSWGNRTLVVDGDPEASTLGNARRTEELLAVLPLLLHPAPERFLEVGLGSGITLATAARFPLSRVDCVEIARSVIRAVAFFEPDNRRVAAEEGVTIQHADARRLLARTAATYDVVSANTLHPWSVGATGLYSREYFSRIAGALRPGGIAVQWLPTERIGGDSLSLILRTFFQVFPEGGLWWGAGNVIAIGSSGEIADFDGPRSDARLAAAGIDPMRLGWSSAADLPSQFIGDADAVRAATGAGPLLSDDRPLLEVRAAARRGAEASAGLFGVLAVVARSGTASDPMQLWLESLELRAGGDESAADAREGLAADLGLRVARSAQASRIVLRAEADLRGGRLEAASLGFRSALAIEPDDRYARFGQAGVAIRNGDLDAAIADLRRLVADWPDDVRAWNELAGVLFRRGDAAGALRAAERALAANPFDLAALANVGLISLENGDADRARDMLDRIRSLSPLGRSPQEVSLRDSLADLEGSQ